MFIAVCIYRLVMINIDLSETTQKSALEIQDKFQSDTKSENFFFQQNFFPDKNFFQTEFCLGLHTTVVFCMQLFIYIVQRWSFGFNFCI